MERTMTRKPRSLSSVELPPWKFIVFADLHVSAKTLTRALDLLSLVRDMADDHHAKVVCLGDFWDQRGVLNVRQLDALLSHFDTWKARGIELVMVPGNHDQVTVDGSIHSVRVFDPYLNVTVATEPLLWPEQQIAFLPWRETPSEQEAMFEGLCEWTDAERTKGDAAPFTIFGHAEVGGAQANSGARALGRVSPKTIKKVASACYLGHYHKRQQVSDRIWYIGSPFEMDFGERGQPHGIALIEQGNREPMFIDLPGFAKHHRFIFGERWDLSAVCEQDIVEVHVLPDDIGTETLSKALGSIVAKDVRPLPVKVVTEKGAPAFALSLDDAVEAYVEAKSEAAGLGSVKTEMVQLGRSLIAEVPEARGIVPLSGNVQIESVTIEGFCAIRDQVNFDMKALGMTLLRGPMGAGKTSIMDGLTWCLFGVTTPRKAGVSGASLRADEVVHDDAEQATVVAYVRAGTQKVTIRRTKKRGQGARVSITGITAPDGISDQQALIHHVVGVDYDLWRTCVYLGQGAVGNFVTDADKNRKLLLSAAFGLGACPAAQKRAREQVQQLSPKADKLRIDVAANERVVAALSVTDFTEQIVAWEKRQKAADESFSQAIREGEKTVEQCDAALSQEKQWIDSKRQHETHLDKLMKALTSYSMGSKAADLQRQIGAMQAEKAIIHRDQAKVSATLQKLIEDARTGQALCPTCGRPFETIETEQHIHDYENKSSGFVRQIGTLDTRISNLAMELDEFSRTGSTNREGIEKQIAESRDAIAKCHDAVNTFTRIRQNRQNALDLIVERKAEQVRVAKNENPFRSQQSERDEKIAVISAQLQDGKEQLATTERDLCVFGFWVDGFGAKGIPALVLRTALYELETHANRFLARLLHGRIFCQLVMDEDDLKINFFENAGGESHPRRYEQLSGGERRCAELAFNPFALSEMVFTRTGVRVSLIVIDELTTHLSPDEKPIVCQILRELDRETILVIDHDITVQAEFDRCFEVSKESGTTTIERAS
jgi:DNA repair exonuclease SbcCD ATPase subunit/DNA repair exonuclease SbcCD nuclease subunit